MCPRSSPRSRSHADDPAFANPTKPVGRFFTEADAAADRRRDRLGVRRGFRPRLAARRAVADAAQDPRCAGDQRASRRRRDPDRGGRRRDSGGARSGRRPSRRRGGDRQGFDERAPRRRRRRRCARDAHRRRSGRARFRPADAARGRADDGGGSGEASADGQFPPGSMGPKIAAALRFLDARRPAGAHHRARQARARRSPARRERQIVP